jgi:hypothetical protein
VFSGAGVAVMGSIGVTTLHPQGPRDPDLPLAPKAVPPSSEGTLRAVCRDGDLLCAIPMNMVLESHSRGERVRQPMRSGVNSRLSKRMVLPGAR